MKKEIFEGVIDGKKFDNLEEFQNYLNEHSDAKDISYTHSIREVADKNPTKAIPTNPVVDKSDKKTYNIYPPQFDLDEIMSQENDLEEFKKGYDVYLMDHKKAIQNMGEELLEEHLDNLQQLRLQTKGLLKQNDQAISSIESDIKQNEDQINKLNKEIKCLQLSVEKCKVQIQEHQDKLNLLNKADEFIKIRYRALKQAIGTVEHNREISKREPVESTKSAFDRLLTTLGIF